MAIDSDSKPLKACFSFAAYSKYLIDHLKSSGVPIQKGLTDVEFSSVESTLGFTFPPDLRSVLQEGLPVGPGFPNWRSMSIQQLQVLTNSPNLSLCKKISRNHFWLDSWGERPKDDDRAVSLGKGFLMKVPVLVPVYRNFYIPSKPCLAGNPVLYVHGGDVRLWSFDLGGFFHQIELKEEEEKDVLKRPTLSRLMNAPAWAATEPRRIEFWTEMVERGERLEARGGSSDWWSGGCLEGCLEEVFWRLRNGGWKEEDVMEMMMMGGGGGDDVQERNGTNVNSVVIDRKCIARHLKILSKRLLRAGWSAEDVLESLRFSSDDNFSPSNPNGGQEDSSLGCQKSISNKCNGNQGGNAAAKETMNKHSSYQGFIPTCDHIFSRLN